MRCELFEHFWARNALPLRELKEISTRTIHGTQSIFNTPLIYLEISICSTQK